MTDDEDQVLSPPCEANKGEIKGVIIHLALYCNEARRPSQVVSQPATALCRSRRESRPPRDSTLPECISAGPRSYGPTERQLS